MFKGPIRIHGSGRTDAGVHARGQVFHFDAAWPHGADRLCKALRCGLPGTIQIRSARVVAADFHSRVQATRKRYVYHVQLGEADPFTKPFCVEMFRPLDFEAMAAAARTRPHGRRFQPRLPRRGRLRIRWVFLAIRW